MDDQAPEGGGGDSRIKGAEMLVRNFEINPQKETILGVAQPFFNPQKRPF